MIVVDSDGLIINWLKKNLEDVVGATRLDLITFELANGIDNDLILVQDVCLNQMDKTAIDKLSKMKAVIIFKSVDLEVKINTQNIVSIIDQNTNIDLLANQINFLEDAIRKESIVKSQLLSLHQELHNVMGGVETQLLRIKKSYERHAPKRLEDFKGLTVYSKYAAGEDMGGEFFDTFSVGNKVFIMMSASSSYLASSSILEHFSDLKSASEINSDLEHKFIHDIKNDIVDLNKNKKKPIETKILTCIIDFRTNKLTGHMFGDFQIIHSKNTENLQRNCSLEGDLKAAEINLQLERGERILFNSPGFISNWSLSNPEFLIEELVRNKEIKVLDILDEVYFQLRKQSESNFLVHDASSIILEVNENVMVQI